MTAIQPPRRGRLQLLPRTVTLLIGIVGFVLDISNLANVPGASHLIEGKSQLTDFGVGLGFLVLGAWATVWLRRRLPLVPAIAGAVLLLVGVSYLLFLVGVVHLALRYRERTVLLAWVTGGAVVGFVLRDVFTGWGGWWVSRMVSTDGSPLSDGQTGTAAIVFPIVVAVLSLGAAVGIVAFVRTRGQATASRDLAAREHRRADALHDQVVRQNERERIARDVHDALAHRLSVVSLHAGALAAAAGTDEQSAEMARTVREQTHAALEEMRGLVGGLRSPDDGRGGAASIRALPELVARLRATGARIDATLLFEDVGALTGALDGAAYRIVQEALTNALKHAPGAPIDLHLTASPVAQIRIRVTNPLAVPVPRTPEPGYGVVGIRERAASLGGTAWIGEHDGAHIVDVSLPWLTQA